MMVWLVLFLAMGIPTEGDSVVTATLHLHAIGHPEIDATAYYMSAGPAGPVPSDFVDTAEFPSMRAMSSNLRVTMHSCERDWWITIDQMITRDADTRSVVAQYYLPDRDLLSLGARVSDGSTSNPEPVTQPIVWASATAFELIRPGRVILIEHLVGSDFRVTVRPRLR